MPQLLLKGSFHWSNQQQKVCPHRAMQHSVELKYIRDQFLSRLSMEPCLTKCQNKEVQNLQDTKITRNASTKFRSI